MPKRVGPFMRLGGLVVEMLGVFSVLKANDGIFATRVHLPEMEPIPIGWLGVGLGFLLWLLGTVLVYWPRPSRKKESGTEVEETLSR